MTCEAREWMEPEPLDEHIATHLSWCKNLDCAAEFRDLLVRREILKLANFGSVEEMIAGLQEIELDLR